MFYFRIYPVLILSIFHAVSLSAGEWENYNAAVQFFQQAEFDSAIQYASRIEKTDSLYFYAQLLTGHAWLELDDLDQAENIFTALMTFPQNRAYVYNGLGLCHFYRYNQSRAITRFFRKVFSVDELEKSISLFDRAIRLNPEYLDPRLNRNRARIVTGNSDSLYSAVEDLKLLKSAYPDNLEIQYYLGKAEKEIGNIDGAISVFQKIIGNSPGHSGAHLALAFIYFDRGEYELFSSHYLMALPSLYEKELLRDLYRDILDIMNPADLQYAESHPITGQFFLEFWQKRDPVKITAKNERLIEHYRRLEYARANYPGTNKAGYDDRGRIYVKYGPPDDYYRFNTVDGFVLENESWVYHIGEDTYNFDFVNKQNGYVLTSDLSSALVNPDYRSSLNNLRDLYNRRAHLSQYYATVSRELASVDPRGTSDYLMAVTGALNLSAAREKVKKENLPVSVYKLEMQGSDLPFDFDIFKYYEPDSARWFADFIYKLDLKELDMNYRDLGYELNLEEKAMVFPPNIGGKPYQVVKKIDIRTEKQSSAGIFAGKVTSPLFLGKNQIHFQLKERDSDRYRIIQDDLVTEYAREQLKVSDLLLSTDIHSPLPSDNEQFSRKNYYIHPDPGRTFSKENPVYCYFEIYNIAQNDIGKGRCLIETRIQHYQTGRNLSAFLDLINPFSSGTVSKSAVSITNEMEFSGRFEPVSLAFDVSHLEPGVYEFTIKVTDQNSKQTASTKKLLQLTY